MPRRPIFPFPEALPKNAAYGAGGVTVAAVDPDGGSFTYSLLDNAGGRFAVNSSTGAITVATGASSLIDYEASAAHTYAIMVQAIDNGNLSYTKALNVQIANQNERPALRYGPFSVNENTGPGTMVGTVAASDPDICDELWLQILLLCRWFGASLRRRQLRHLVCLGGR
jgi:hypothetical protein